MELERGTPWGEILQKAMLPALNQVGDEFSKGTAFLPELIAAGHAMTKSVEVIKAGVPSMGLGGQGIFVIGTIFGDVHDIGKNIVKSPEGAGRVVDLGTDVHPESFAQAWETRPTWGDFGSSQLHHAEYRAGYQGRPQGKPKGQNLVEGALTDEYARNSALIGLPLMPTPAAQRAKELLGKN
jgi:hypothetical protein